MLIRLRRQKRFSKNKIVLKGVYCPIPDKCKSIKNCMYFYKNEVSNQTAKCESLWKPGEFSDGDILKEKYNINLYCPSKCSDIKNDCKHPYGKSCDRISLTSTRKEFKEFIDAYLEIHDSRGYY